MSQSDNETALTKAMKAIDKIEYSNLPRPRSGQNRKPLTRDQKITDNLIITAKDIGLKIKLSRKAMGMTQSKFADLAGVGRRFISELERGKATLEIDRVLKVCIAAGIDIFAISRGPK